MCAARRVSAIGISEPGAGGDPAGMTTRAVRDGDDWVINGRKIWVSGVPQADFTILMAVTDKEKRQGRHLRLPRRQAAPPASTSCARSR